MMPQYNDAQQAAILAREGNVLVAAGAGSGKTAVLTERYFRLLDERVDGRTIHLDEILTLTFTRKAAQEMRERIARKFEGEGRLHERRLLGSAPIGTMHSFCEGVLRDYALAAGIDPHFRLLDEAEARTMQENTLDVLFADLWSGTHTEREEIARLLLDLRQGELRRALMSMYATLRSRGIAIDSVHPRLSPALPPLAAQLAHAVAALRAYDGSAAWKKFAGPVIAGFEHLMPLPAGDDSFQWDTHDAMREWIAALSLRGNYKPEARQAVNNVKSAAEAWADSYLDLASLEYLRAFLTLLLRFDQRFRRAKDEQGLLDFDDLLLLTRDLLCDSAMIGAHLTQRFRHIMVDEFQDTNALQFSIINGLRQQASLFLVGDVKQAIYRFIGSDISVFLAEEQRILDLTENGQRVPLLVNYRTRADILEPLNALFLHIWPLDARQRRFTFEPLSAGGHFIVRTEPSIECAFWDAGSSGIDELRDREARWIARRILQLTGKCDGSEALRLSDAQGDDARVARFADIMLLFRASTDIPLYEQALREADIPFYTVSGRGFYGTREVQDILYLLRALENPYDDFAMAIVLRSPLADVSDDALYWLTRDWTEWQADTPYPNQRAPRREHGVLWEHLLQLETMPAIDAADRASLAKFRDLLLQLQPQALANQPLELIDAILAETGYALTLLAMDDGEQRYANMQKLREVAATFQARGIFGLADFQRYLTKLGEQATREASAPLDVEGSDVVRLMTIHASKGLEAPIVVLADAGRDFHRPNDLFLYTEDGLACQVPTPDEGSLKPTSYQQAQELIFREERDEAERLLYVALTRARENLICSGCTSFPARERWMSYADILAGLLELHSVPETTVDLPLDYEDTAYRVRIHSEASLREVEAILPPRPHPTLWEAFAPQLLAGEALPLLTDAEDVDHFVRIYDHLRPLPPQQRNEALRLGVHRALCYRRCPRQYWFRYHLGMDTGLPPVPDREGNATPNVEDEQERVDGTEFGRLLHALLQQCDFTLPLAEQSAHIIQQWDTQQTEPLDTPTRQRLLACAAAFSALPLAETLKQARPCHRELHFLAREGQVLIPGIIDLLARIDNEWWIIDYKTGRPTADHLRQVAIYALGATHALNAAPQRMALVYFQDDGHASVREEAVTDTLLQEARTVIQTAGEGVRAGRFPALPGRHCSYCPALASCPQGSEHSSPSANSC